jgi:hypothetical protein
MMAEVTAIEFVVPALDPRNTGTNATGGEIDGVSNAAVVGARAVGAAENEGDIIGAGASQLELYATGPVEGEGGVRGDSVLQKCTRTDN